MAYDPDEKFWKRDQDGYNPAEDKHADDARRRGYGVNMDERKCEKEPSRCTLCNSPQRLEFRAQYQVLVGVKSVWRTVITTEWPVVVCANGHRFEM